MLIDEEESSRRLNSPNNLLNRLNLPSGNGSHCQVIQKSPNHTSGPPKFIKTTVGLLAAGGNQKQLAKEFGISEPSVSHYKHGKDGADGKVVRDTVEKVRELAVERLMQSLNLMDDNKLSELGAKDLSGIAANMSRVIEKTAPRQDGANLTQLIVYAPRLKDEDDYKIIDVVEESR